MSTRASAWPRSANISGNKQKTSLFRSEKGKAPGRALFLFAPGAQNFFAAKRPGLFFAPRGRRRFFPKGKCSQPPILFSAAQPPRPFLAAPQVRRPTQGACGSGDRSLFQSKGAPLRCVQRGTKENGPLEWFKRERARGTIAAFLRKCSAAPHRGPRAICQRGQCRARRRELQEWSDQSPSHWGPRRAQRGGEWNHVPP